MSENCFITASTFAGVFTQSKGSALTTYSVWNAPQSIPRAKLNTRLNIINNQNAIVIPEDKVSPIAFSVLLQLLGNTIQGINPTSLM